MRSRKYVLELWRKQHGDVFRILSRLRQWEYRAFHPDEGKLDQSLSVRSTCAKQTTVNTSHIIKDILGSHGITILYRRHYGQECRTSSKLMDNYGAHMLIPCMARSVSSQALDKPVQSANKTKKDISTIEDPFDAPTYNIPEKLVTFTEGASYNVIILAGLGVVVAATYAIFKELIFEPKEYKIFNKALKRIQDDAQVNNMMLLSSLWLGRELDTLYGQESRNRAAHQRIPNRTWTDEDSEEHVEVNFYIRGPHGAGKVFTEMYKDKTNGQWMYTYLIIEIRIPSPAQLILESYLPAYAAP